MTYEPVIGLEVHAEMLTRSKMFCGCAVVDSTAAPANTVVCPVCAGLPGTLPVINERAVEFALRVALALNCEVPPLNVFARKNYFYPDLPKGYQISQYELPLAVNGWMALDGRRIRIRRVHLEEDTGKLFHVEARDGQPDYSLVDLNRAGVPLLEIVTEPDLPSVESVRAFAEALRRLLRYLGVNSGDMEKGVIRFEANVSVRPAGSDELRTRVEIKNLNSFRALERAVAHEIERQTEVWQAGGTVTQQTVGWDEVAGRTLPQRGKEHAHDYRYFPEPDLPPLVIAPEWVEHVRAGLPELPAARQARFESAYGLSPYDASLLIEERAVADYFEAAVEASRSAAARPRALAHWITGEMFRLLNETGQSIAEARLTPAHLAALADLVADETVNLNSAKAVFAESFATGRAPQAVVAERGLAQVSDAAVIDSEIEAVLAAHAEQVAAYLGGKSAVEQWFFGQVMKRLRGRGNPQQIRAGLSRALRKLKGGPS